MIDLEPREPEGLRASWRAISAHWDGMIQRAEQLPASTLHASVHGEFSFVQTLRHLVFAIDKWFTVPILGGAFSPMGLPNTGSLDFPFPGLDLDASPSFGEVLSVRRDRASKFSAYLADLDPATLDESREVYENGSEPLLVCLHTVLEEEHAHLGYATRDLDALSDSSA
jgi:hypothetical protein